MALPVIVNPQVAMFVNNNERPAADAIFRAIRTLEQFVSLYSSYGIGPLVAGNSTLTNSYVVDGQPDGNGGVSGGSTTSAGLPGDGRTPLLGYDVDNFNGQAVALLNWINSQSGMLAALSKPSQNNSPSF